ncbi:MAG: glutathione S-transferase N-terminal domain-containing protein, partial [Pseudomonadota bacterium]
MLTLYSMPSSGNSYKVRLTLAHLGLPFNHITTEWNEGRELTKQADFLKLNPAGKVPMVELEDGRTLAESNAITLYLAEGS